jgi:hypothetical protein
LAENGQMAIHLPLDSSRIGAFSTHTAHPTVLARMSTFLSCVLRTSIEVENPFVHRTKAEVVQCVCRDTPDLVATASSCWRNSRLRAGVTHCGSCVPCFVRRIALECHGPDPTAYDRDVWRERITELAWNDDGRRNLTDLAQFVYQFSRCDSEEILTIWPDLISSDFDANAVIEMYRRFAREAMTVWARYPELGPLTS